LGPPFFLFRGRERTLDKRLLLYGGMLSPLLYLAADVIGGLLTPGYVFREQAVSELLMVGAEYRGLTVTLVFASSIAGILFGVGLVLHFNYGRSKLLFIGSVLMIVSALSTSMTSTAFPQDPIDGEVTFAGTMHLTLVGINVVISIVFILMLGIGLNKEFGWKTFRIYSFITLALMALGGVISVQFIANDIHYLGVSERLSIYAYLVWSAVMAWMLLKEPGLASFGTPSEGNEGDGHDDGTDSQS
jgi:hypothetical protein